MIEKTFLNSATNKQWRIEIDGHTIRTCLNGGKVKEILCDSAFQVKSKAASAMMGQMRKGLVSWLVQRQRWPERHAMRFRRMFTAICLEKQKQWICIKTAFLYHL